ncbi:hypothetical protein NSZ01_21120 [Nocardioides szechwanensis]|nr:hypothetical protein NSZ01_21120 [Nocardioides szechwanensis]
MRLLAGHSQVVDLREVAGDALCGVLQRVEGRRHLEPVVRLVAEGGAPGEDKGKREGEGNQVTTTHENDSQAS